MVLKRALYINYIALAVPSWVEWLICQFIRGTYIRYFVHTDVGAGAGARGNAVAIATAVAIAIAIAIAIATAIPKKGQ